MSPQLEKIKADVLALPQQDRACLAGILVESLDDDAEQDVEAAWLEEIRRRDAALRAGTARTKPAAQALQHAREQLRCRR